MGFSYMYNMARPQRVHGEGGWWGVVSILSMSFGDEEA